MRKKTTPEIEKQVQFILGHNREYIRKELIKFIERINYLEGEKFYKSIKKE